jgi:putative membrane protein
MRLLLIWLINTIALFALPWLMDSIQIDSFTTALLAALVLALVNTLIRPILLVLTLPFTVLTLGLFIFVINGLMFWAASEMVAGFHVAGFMSAVLGALLYSVISWALSALLINK